MAELTESLAIGYRNPLRQQPPPTEILCYCSFWNAIVITDEMSFSGRDIVVEEVRCKLSVKRILRMDEHVRLWKSRFLRVLQDNGQESSTQQSSVGSVAACTKYAKTRE
jgi:hypothetical protein